MGVRRRKKTRRVQIDREEGVGHPIRERKEIQT
jgi:hypothetical protein